MNALEFEQWYAERDGLTVDELRVQGRIVVPCRCGTEGCKGWASYPADILSDLKAMGRVPEDWDWPPQA